MIDRKLIRELIRHCQNSDTDQCLTWISSLFDDEFVRDKCTVMTKWDAMCDDSRNSSNDLDSLEDFLIFGRKYRVTLVIEDIGNVATCRGDSSRIPPAPDVRITCQNVEDFIANLDGVNVHDNVVYADRSNHVISAIVTERIYQASAVIERGGGQFLLQLGQNCGQDIDTADGHLDGSEMRDRVHCMLRDYCEQRGLTVKPGILET